MTVADTTSSNDAKLVWQLLQTINKTCKALISIEEKAESEQIKYLLNSLKTGLTKQHNVLNNVFITPTKKYVWIKHEDGRFSISEQGPLNE